MLDYNEFKEELRTKMQELFPECIATFNRADKVNNNLTEVLTLRKKDSNIGTNINLHNIYADYEDGVAFNDIINNYELMLISAFDNIPAGIEDMSNITSKSFDELIEEKKIILQVMNYDKNKSLLRDCEFTILGDLAVVPTILVSDGATSIINKGLFETLNKDNLPKTEIFDKLKQATFETSEFKVTLMNSFNQMSIAMPIDKAIDCIKEEAIPSLITISNSTLTMGANCLLFPELFKPFAEHYGNDVYILPSSRHEVIIMDSSLMPKESVQQMVKDVNRTSIEPIDFLSDNVYLYNKETQKIEMATGKEISIDNINKKNNHQLGKTI